MPPSIIVARLVCKPMNYLQIDYIIIGDASETQLNLLEPADNYCGMLGMWSKHQQQIIRPATRHRKPPKLDIDVIFLW